MANFWHYLGLCVGLECICLCWGYPLAGGERLRSFNSWPIMDSSSMEWSMIISIACLISTVMVLIGCLCCRPSKGFQEFTDSTAGSNPALNRSSDTHEFTVFPPLPPELANQAVRVEHSANQPIRFEPLPDIRPQQIRQHAGKKPASYNNALSRGLDAQDWFGVENREFPRQQLQYLREIGRGWFGRCVLGQSQPGSDIASPSAVVVKILHEDASPTDKMYFLHEVRPYRDLNHRNVLKLVARCLEADPFLVLLVACPMGDLKSWLRGHQSEASWLTLRGVTLNMACDIAAGLQHMLDNDFVHTDLAARNCLVTSDLSVKIGDYGDTIEAYKEDYYIAGDLALPVRWCAPETVHCTDTTIETKQVTPTANVWSYGVTLWELEEWGRRPYDNFSDDEVVSIVLGAGGRSLPLPTLASPHRDHLYKVMQQCWSPASTRPALPQVSSMIGHLRRSGERQQPDDFERRWASFQPNQAAASPHDSLSSPQPSMSSDWSLQDKSASLTNLHGSLEDLSLEEASFVEKISEAIRDLDDALASQQTWSSSSESSPEKTAWPREPLRRSVADLMVLTHIEPDSEPASLDQTPWQYLDQSDEEETEERGDGDATIVSCEARVEDESMPHTNVESEKYQMSSDTHGARVKRQCEEGSSPRVGVHVASTDETSDQDRFGNKNEEGNERASTTVQREDEEQEVNHSFVEQEMFNEGNEGSKSNSSTQLSCAPGFMLTDKSQETVLESENLEIAPEKQECSLEEICPPSDNFEGISTDVHTEKVHNGEIAKGVHLNFDGEETEEESVIYFDNGLPVENEVNLRQESITNEEEQQVIESVSKAEDVINQEKVAMHTDNEREEDLNMSLPLDVISKDVEAEGERYLEDNLRPVSSDSVENWVVLQKEGFQLVKDILPVDELSSQLELVENLCSEVTHVNSELPVQENHNDLDAAKVSSSDLQPFPSLTFGCEVTQIEELCPANELDKPDAEDQSLTELNSVGNTDSEVQHVVRLDADMSQFSIEFEPINTHDEEVKFVEDISLRTFPELEMKQVEPVRELGLEKAPDSTADKFVLKKEPRNDPSTGDTLDVKESSVVLGACDDFSLDFFHGLKTSYRESSDLISTSNSFEKQHLVPKTLNEDSSLDIQPMLSHLLVEEKADLDLPIGSLPPQVKAEQEPIKDSLAVDDSEGSLSSSERWMIPGQAEYEVDEMEAYLREMEQDLEDFDLEEQDPSIQSELERDPGTKQDLEDFELRENHLEECALEQHSSDQSNITEESEKDLEACELKKQNSIIKSELELDSVTKQDLSTEKDAHGKDCDVEIKDVTMKLDKPEAIKRKQDDDETEYSLLEVDDEHVLQDTFEHANVMPDALDIETLQGDITVVAKVETGSMEVPNLDRLELSEGEPETVVKNTVLDVVDDSLMLQTDALDTEKVQNDNSEVAKIMEVSYVDKFLKLSNKDPDTVYILKAEEESLDVTIEDTKRLELSNKEIETVDILKVVAESLEHQAVVTDALDVKKVQGDTLEVPDENVNRLELRETVKKDTMEALKVAEDSLVTDALHIEKVQNDPLELSNKEPETEKDTVDVLKVISSFTHLTDTSDIQNVQNDILEAAVEDVNKFELNKETVTVELDRVETETSELSDVVQNNLEVLKLEPKSLELDNVKNGNLSHSKKTEGDSLEFATTEQGHLEHSSMEKDIILDTHFNAAEDSSLEVMKSEPDSLELVEVEVAGMALGKVDRDVEHQGVSKLYNVEVCQVEWDKVDCEAFDERVVRLQSGVNEDAIQITDLDQCKETGIKDRIETNAVLELEEAKENEELDLRRTDDLDKTVDGEVVTRVKEDHLGTDQDLGGLEGRDLNRVRQDQGERRDPLPGEELEEEEKQTTPDEERSSDSGFRDRSSESCDEDKHLDDEPGMEEETEGWFLHPPPPANEILVQYGVYQAPLSPILEESSLDYLATHAGFTLSPRDARDPAWQRDVTAALMSLARDEGEEEEEEDDEEESKTSVVMENLDSPGAPELVAATGQQRLEDLLLVDTETNAARLVESPQPEVHRAFVSPVSTASVYKTPPSSADTDSDLYATPSDQSPSTTSIVQPMKAHSEAADIVADLAVRRLDQLLSSSDDTSPEHFLSPSPQSSRHFPSPSSLTSNRQLTSPDLDLSSSEDNSPFHFNVNHLLLPSPEETSRLFTTPIRDAETSQQNLTSSEETSPFHVTSIQLLPSPDESRHFTTPIRDAGTSQQNLTSSEETSPFHITSNQLLLPSPVEESRHFTTPASENKNTQHDLVSSEETSPLHFSTQTLLTTSPNVESKLFQSTSELLPSLDYESYQSNHSSSEESSPMHFSSKRLLLPSPDEELSRHFPIASLESTQQLLSLDYEHLSSEETSPLHFPSPSVLAPSPDEVSRCYTPEEHGGDRNQMDASSGEISPVHLPSQLSVSSPDDDSPRHLPSPAEDLASSMLAFSSAGKHEMSTKFDDYAPDWEDDSESDSSSSGEFVWQDGDREALADIRQSIRPNSKDYMEVIAEEDEDDEDDDDDDDDDDESSGSGAEFVPSAWNSQAVPVRSALRSEGSQHQKRSVRFKKQKYHCVYEYPREEEPTSHETAAASEPTSTINLAVDYSSYADWELDGGSEAESDSDSEPVEPRRVESYDFYKLSSDDFNTGAIDDGEFFISSSARPFQTYRATSQFFPGQTEEDEEEIDTSDRDLSEIKEATFLSDISPDSEPISDIIKEDNVNEDTTIQLASSCTASSNEVEDKVVNNNITNEDHQANPIKAAGDEAKVDSEEQKTETVKNNNNTDVSGKTSAVFNRGGLGELRHARDQLKLDLLSLDEASNAALLLDEARKRGRAEDSEEDSGIESGNGTIQLPALVENH